MWGVEWGGGGAAGYSLVCRTPYPWGAGGAVKGWLGGWVGQRPFSVVFWEAWTPPPPGVGGRNFLGAGFASLGTRGH